MPFVTLSEPLIGWKKCTLLRKGYNAYHHNENSYLKYVLVNLLIPKGATVYTESDYVSDEWTLGRSKGKKRASRAKVLCIEDLDGRIVKTKGLVVPISHTFRNGMTYRVGKMMKPSSFSTKEEQCAGGIHFFTTDYEALLY